MKRRDNQWPSGKRNWTKNRLPPWEMERGVLPMVVTLRNSGESEVMIAFYDRSGFLEDLSRLGRIALVFNHGFFKTPFGAIGVDLWGLKQAGRLVWTVESMRSTNNLHLDNTLAQLDRLSHLHYLLGDRHGFVADALECQNTLNFESVAKDHQDFLSALPCSDHGSAVEYLYSKHSAKELARMLFKEDV